MKFSEILEKQIETKAEKEQEVFFKKWQTLSTEYSIPYNVIFDGIDKNYTRQKKDPFERKPRFFDFFIQRETNKFLQELQRLESYFEKKDYF